jgi:hypothetical protein
LAIQSWQATDSYAELIAILNLAREQFASHPVIEACSAGSVSHLFSPEQRSGAASISTATSTTTTPNESESAIEVARPEGQALGLTDWDLAAVHAACLLLLTETDSLEGNYKVAEGT